MSIVVPVLLAAIVLVLVITACVVFIKRQGSAAPKVSGERRADDEVGSVS